MPRKKKIRIIEKKLGRERAWGQRESGDNRIQIDPRLKSQRRMTIVLHEALHVLFPKMSETLVDKTSIELSRLLWSDRYRRLQS